MELSIDPVLKKWLKNKNKNIITIGVIVTRGGGCCGGYAFMETIIDYGKPKDKPNSYLLFEEDGLQIYVANVLEKKTDKITLYLKGALLKRIALKGYEPD